MEELIEMDNILVYKIMFGCWSICSGLLQQARLSLIGGRVFYFKEEFQLSFTNDYFYP